MPSFRLVAPRVYGPFGLFVRMIRRRSLIETESCRPVAVGLWAPYPNHQSKHRIAERPSGVGIPEKAARTRGRQNNSSSRSNYYSTVREAFAR